MFSQTTEYALRVMAWLALSPDTLVPTVTLAEKTKVPTHYLAKVLQQLAAAQLVTGRRGVRGGYKLARPAAEINLLTVVRAVDVVERIHTCPLGLANHGPNLCPLHRTVDLAAKAIIDILDDRTLADLLTEHGSSKPLCDEEATAKLTISVAKRGL